MTASTAIRLIEKALSPDETQQFEFASRFELVLTAFPPKVVISELYPFLATWIPRNNERIVKALSEKVDKMVSVKGSIVAFAPVLESLLASENKQIAAILKAKLKAYKPEGDVFSFFKRLLASPLDFVRAFVPQITHLVLNPEEKKQIYSSISYDSAYKVRFASIISIPTLDAELAQQVATTFCNDAHSRIRSLLPVVCSCLPFWLTAIAPILQVDHDWSVRASLAKELVKCQDCNAALALAVKLTEDNVWQVTLCALGSVTQILEANQTANIENVQYYLSTLSKIIGFTQSTLKNAVINVFLSIYGKGSSSLNHEQVFAFVDDVISKQPSSVKLHFLEALGQSKSLTLLNLIRNKLFEVIVSLLKCDQWRVRLGVIQVLINLVCIENDPELRKLFSGLCLNSLADESAPVREAASISLANFFIQEKGTTPLPTCFAELKSSDSFRKRQSAILLLKDIIKISNDPKIKQNMLQEIAAFESDSCINVAMLAKQFSAELK